MIRVAAMADVAALHILVERAFRGDAARGGWTHEADLLGGQRTDPAALADTVAAADRRILILGPPDALLGCVQVTQVSADRAALGLLAVLPDRQGRGTGRRLIAAAEATARAAFGARAMEMTVIAQRGMLIAWYERHGYARTGETRPFPLDDPRFGLPLTRDLWFVVLERAL